MIFLKKYIKKYWKLFCLAVSCLTLEAACDLTQPTIMSKIVDIGVANKDINYVLHMSILMLVVTAAGALAASSRNILASNVSQRFGAEMRYDLFKKIQSFSFENLDKFEGASLITRLTNDVTQVQNFANGLMRIFVKAPLLCIGSIIMAARLNLQLTLILTIVIPIVTVLIIGNVKIGYPLFSKVQKALDKVNSVMREYLAGVRVVKAFNYFDYEVSRFQKANEEIVTTTTKAMRTMSIFSPSISLVVNIGIVLVIWIGAIKVSYGTVQVGQIIAFVNYMTQILFSLMTISNVFNMFVRARASAERIADVFNQENKIKYKDTSIVNIDKGGKIEFNNVSFTYAGASGEPVLRNITFQCKPGETIGIIGSTGSGKSSLINLIPRFYDVSSGNVKVNDVDVRDINPDLLRNLIAIVPQKTVLFTGTILENIRWGNKNANMEEVQRAAAVAQAHDFISYFPEGYNTMLGQGGVNLSGGQKQRISIARALIKRPQILILDDSTSAVDVTTELMIREALKEYLDKLTCIIIAQRITSVMEADRIIVLDDGEIVGCGKHPDLMQNCRVYQDIFQSQLGKGSFLDE